MKKILIATLVAASLLSACMMAPAGRHGRGQDSVMIVPFLPPLVVLDLEPFYFYNGFHYHYTNDRWYYSRARTGPWVDLPRDHYPKEVRFKGRDRDRDRDRDDDHRGHDNRHR